MTGTPPTATATGTPTATDAPIDTAAPTNTPTMHLQGHFEDVPPAHPFYTYIEDLAYRGVPAGIPAVGRSSRAARAGFAYRPGNNVTRSQASKIVASAAGVTAIRFPSDQQTFADVVPGSTFWLWIDHWPGGVPRAIPVGGRWSRASRRATALTSPWPQSDAGPACQDRRRGRRVHRPDPSDQQTFEDVPGGLPSGCGWSRQRFARSSAATPAAGRANRASHPATARTIGPATT